MKDANTLKYCMKDILWQSQGKTNLLSQMNTREILIRIENMPLGEYAPPQEEALLVWYDIFILQKG